MSKRGKGSLPNGGKICHDLCSVLRSHLVVGPRYSRVFSCNNFDVFLHIMYVFLRHVWGGAGWGRAITFMLRISVTA